ncbi:MAG: CoA-binding protein, partial [Anaerolineaceae bacterium]|nr:CoA-binding protein [Anaerolineaceae bacterium]
SDIKPQVDGVFINVKPEKVIGILQEVKKTGIKKVWLQQGAESEDALKFAKENYLDLSTNGCILMYLEPVKGLHSFHRWIWRLVKKY